MPSHSSSAGKAGERGEGEEDGERPVVQGPRFLSRCCRGGGIVLDLERKSTATSVRAGTPCRLGGWKPVDDYDKYKMSTIIIHLACHVDHDTCA